MKVYPYIAKPQRRWKSIVIYLEAPSLYSSWAEKQSFWRRTREVEEKAKEIARQFGLSEKRVTVRCQTAVTACIKGFIRVYEGQGTEEEIALFKKMTEFIQKMGL